LAKKVTRIIIPLICVLLVVVAGLVVLYFIGDQKMENGDTSVDAYIGQIDEFIQMGDDLAKEGLHLQAGYFYGQAGAAASSLRYTAESILYLKGEGDSLEELTAESPYAGWDEIAQISFVSPYPYYFEGLLFHVQGMNDEAAEAYANAALNPSFPESGLNFYYLKNETVTELYALRDNLLEVETNIYTKYEPHMIGYPRDPLNYDPVYLRSLARYSLDLGDYELAFARAATAVMVDPFTAEGFLYAGTCALMCEQYYDAARYVEEGLLIAPDDESLLRLCGLISELATTVEGGIDE
jgi:tetratricopeptide (TPR) repeat protein